MSLIKSGCQLHPLLVSFICTSLLKNWLTIEAHELLFGLFVLEDLQPVNRTVYSLLKTHKVEALFEVNSFQVESSRATKVVREEYTRVQLCIRGRGTVFVTNEFSIGYNISVAERYG